MAKKQTKKTTKKRSTKKSTAKAPRKAAVDRPFPRVTIEDALRVPEALKSKNNGRAYASSDVAKAVDLGAKGTQFFYLTAGSRDYGLTTGTRDAPKIELTDLGKSVVYPESAAEKSAALLEAFRSVDVFRRVLEHFDGMNLPEMEYLSNTLTKEFGLHPDVHQDFVRIYKANCEFIGLDTLAARSREPKKSDLDLDAAPAQTVVDVSKVDDPDAPLCFVILPFSERDPKHPAGFFGEVLKQLIVPAAQSCGFNVRTAKLSGSDVIQRTIVQNLLNAELVIADLTEHNPNVLFELGLRMAQGKPVSILKAEGTPPLFDVDHMIRVYSYSPCLWKSTVEKDLPNITEHIQATWDNQGNQPSYLEILSGAKI
ncbi:MAG: hypothetical protein NXI14_08910 [bacterium]|nr:hypothetical protein [bacterium]